MCGCVCVCVSVCVYVCVHARLCDCLRRLPARWPDCIFQIRSTWSGAAEENHGKCPVPTQILVADV